MAENVTVAMLLVLNIKPEDYSAHYIYSRIYTYYSLPRFQEVGLLFHEQK